MLARDLYRKYRLLIEDLADERRPTELSLNALKAVLEQFEREAAGFEVKKARFVCDEIADQLEHEAVRATTTHRRAVLLAAVKGIDAMTFTSEKP
jgi:hypothetical protein